MCSYKCIFLNSLVVNMKIVFTNGVDGGRRGVEISGYNAPLPA